MNSPDRPWTDREDKFLIFYGRCLNVSLEGDGNHGYRHVAIYDLRRDPEEAVKRAKHLRDTRPDWVKKLEDEADRD